MTGYFSPLGGYVWRLPFFVGGLSVLLLGYLSRNHHHHHQFNGEKGPPPETQTAGLGMLEVVVTSGILIIYYVALYLCFVWVGSKKDSDGDSGLQSPQ